ncbi:hypothetical protein [Deinococcus hopiensis]|uniref:Uncharacterized protein n=1 Tax=Deinococcus hopiensis KR-140 TaxID=695939 RepID=A0A1W1UY05_9DEIO|nr:hypothetical protein [Deinococcus hopiensis]SMB85634.1 hypothetical protein SAMN00790413_03483 [Deinococcus hopiensis KR-140]
MPARHALTALLPLLLASATAQVSIPVANAHTPATLVNALAVKRNWTVEQSEFCKARAAANAAIAYPKKANSKFKFITTYAFRASSDAKGERSLLDFYGTDFQTPFPWQDGQWLSRQYSYDALP